MAHIKNKLLNIDITAPNDRQLMKSFYDELSRKIPLFARRLHDYMRDVWMPEHPNTTNPICARSPEELSSSRIVQRNVHELPDGWVAQLNANSEGYKGYMARISAAFGLHFDYKFHGPLDDRSL